MQLVSRKLAGGSMQRGDIITGVVIISRTPTKADEAEKHQRSERCIRYHMTNSLMELWWFTLWRDTRASGGVASPNQHGRIDAFHVCEWMKRLSEAAADAAPLSWAEARVCFWMFEVCFWGQRDDSVGGAEGVSLSFLFCLQRMCLSTPAASERASERAALLTAMWTAHNSSFVSHCCFFSKCFFYF